MYFENDLNEQSIPEEYRGYMEGLFRWVDRVRPIVHHMEMRICSPELGFAGTADLVCGIEIEEQGRPAHLLSPFVEVDIKTGDVPPSVGPQTSAYAYEIAPALGLPFIHRACLNLKENGKAKFIWLDNPDDEADFFAALRTIHWRNRHDVNPL